VAGVCRRGDEDAHPTAATVELSKMAVKPDTLRNAEKANQDGPDWRSRHSTSRSRSLEPVGLPINRTPSTGMVVNQTIRGNFTS
jgi:hypothetical protein